MRGAKWPCSFPSGIEVFEGESGKGWHRVLSFVRLWGGEAPFVRRLSRTRSLRVHLRAPTLEVLAYGRGLLRGQHPSRVLCLGIAGHGRSQESANDLAADAQLVREILRAYGLGVCHSCHLLRSIERHTRRVHDVRSHVKRMNERISNVRSLSVWAMGVCRPLGQHALHPPFHPHTGGTRVRIFPRGSAARPNADQANIETTREAQMARWDPRMGVRGGPGLLTRERRSECLRLTVNPS